MLLLGRVRMRRSFLHLLLSACLGHCSCSSRCTHARVQRRRTLAASTSLGSCSLYLGAAVPGTRLPRWMALYLGPLPASTDCASGGLARCTHVSSGEPYSCRSAHQRWLLRVVPRSGAIAVPNMFGRQKLQVGLPCLRLWCTRFPSSRRCTHVSSGDPSSHTSAH